MIVIGLLVLSWAGNTRTARPIGWGFNMLSWKRRDDVLRRRRRHSQWQIAGASLESSFGPLFSNPRAWEERRMRGLSFGDTGHGKWRSSTAAATAIAMAPEAHRGELCLSMEREGRKLGLSEEGIGMLTSKGIESRRLNGGVRWEGSVLGQEQSKQEIGARAGRSGLASLGWRWRAAQRPYL